jgi:hypothetical protein
MTIENIKHQHDDGMIVYRKRSKKVLESISLFCAECMGASRLEKLKQINWEYIKACTDEDCPLFPFLMGKNPYRKKRSMSKTQLEALQRGRKSSLLSKR